MKVVRAREKERVLNNLVHQISWLKTVLVGMHIKAS